LLKLPITVGQQTGSFSGNLSTIRTATTDAVSHECANASFNITVKAAGQTDVKSLKHDVENEKATMYNLNGVRQSQSQQGINIVKAKDGTTRKVVLK
jgi:hypothetical protein